MYRGKYKLIGQEMSMFTRKLEAQLRYQKVPYEWMLKTNANREIIESRTGTRFIPALVTPDGWMISDTISLGPMLHSRFCEVPVLPETPVQRGTSFVLEDFFNHWYPRHALHSRWCYPDNVIVTGIRFGMNTLLGKFIDEELDDSEQIEVANFGEYIHREFGAGACEVQGAGPEHKEAIQSDFSRLLRLLVQHLSNHEFLLGSRACLADFALAGPFKAHFLLDPEPRTWLGDDLKLMESYVDRIWGGANDDSRWLEDDVLPSSIYPLLDYAREHYQVFASSSISAAVRGEKYFTLDLGDGAFVARSMKRLEKARLHVQDELLRVHSEKSSLLDTGALSFYLQPNMFN